MILGRIEQRSFRSPVIKSNRNPSPFPALPRKFITRYIYTNLFPRETHTPAFYLSGLNGIHLSRSLSGWPRRPIRKSKARPSSFSPRSERESMERLETEVADCD